MDILLIAIFAFVLHVTPETTDCFRIIAPDGQEYRAVQEPDRWFRLEQLPLMPNREAQRVILRDGELIIQTNGVENHHTPILTDKEAKIQGTFPQMSMEQEGGIWRIDWRKRLVCFGDSLTSCGGNGGRYSDILSELLPEYEVINRGIGGDTIGGGLVRFDRDVLALNPDLLIFELGANDY